MKFLVLTEEEIAGAGVDDLRDTCRALLAETLALRALISDRTSAAVGDLKEQGLKFNGNLPYGLEADAVTKELRASQREKCMIAEIQKLYVEGRSLRAIARTLTERNFYNRKGKAIDAKQISRILAAERALIDQNTGPE